jgi:hypothetical protein
MNVYIVLERLYDCEKEKFVFVSDMFGTGEFQEKFILSELQENLGFI